MPFLPEFGGGALFSQSFCIALDPNDAKPALVQFTDDVIFGPGKKGVFQLVVLMNRDVDELEARKKDLSGLDKLCPLLYPDEASYFVRRSAVQATHRAAAGCTAFRTASAEEFDMSVLSVGRPPVRGYKEYDMWTGVCEKKFVVLRADRFVFAACDSRQELEQVAVLLKELVL
jgi:hypothetical protein